MSIRLFFVSELAQLAAELTQLPDQVQAQAGALVVQASSDFASTMATQFPTQSDSGDLGRSTSRAVVSELRSIVDNEQFYASFYEFGFTHYTAGKSRRTHTKAQRYGGRGARVEAKNVWVPAAMQRRQQMVEELREIVARASGLQLRLLEVTA